MLFQEPPHLFSGKLQERGNAGFPRQEVLQEVRAKDTTKDSGHQELVTTRSLWEGGDMVFPSPLQIEWKQREKWRG